MGVHIAYRESAPVGARGLALPRGGHCGRAAARACIKTACIKAESMMELRWLQDFLMVAETGNFTRAAEKRNTSQAARVKLPVSATIRKS